MSDTAHRPDGVRSQEPITPTAGELVVHTPGGSPAPLSPSVVSVCDSLCKDSSPSIGRCVSRSEELGGPQRPSEGQEQLYQEPTTGREGAQAFAHPSSGECTGDGAATLDHMKAVPCRVADPMEGLDKDTVALEPDDHGAGTVTDLTRPTCNVLHLCAGTEPLRPMLEAAFPQVNFNVISVDVTARWGATHVMRIEEFAVVCGQSYAVGFFHIIWAGPPCGEYSNAHTTGYRRLDEADARVWACYLVICHFKPVLWIIESCEAHKGIVSRPFIQKLGLHTFMTSQCMFDAPWRKRTVLLSNQYLGFLPVCGGRSQNQCLMKRLTGRHVRTAQLGPSRDTPGAGSSSVVAAYPYRMVEAVLTRYVAIIAEQQVPGSVMRVNAVRTDQMTVRIVWEGSGMVLGQTNDLLWSAGHLDFIRTLIPSQSDLTDKGPFEVQVPAGVLPCGAMGHWLNKSLPLKLLVWKEKPRQGARVQITEIPQPERCSTTPPKPRRTAGYVRDAGRDNHGDFMFALLGYLEDLQCAAPHQIMSLCTGQELSCTSVDPAGLHHCRFLGGGDEGLRGGFEWVVGKPTRGQNESKGGLFHAVEYEGRSRCGALLRCVTYDSQHPGWVFDRLMTGPQEVVITLQERRVQSRAIAIGGLVEIPDTGEGGESWEGEWSTVEGHPTMKGTKVAQRGRCMVALPPLPDECTHEGCEEAGDGYCCRCRVRNPPGMMAAQGMLVERCGPCDMAIQRKEWRDRIVLDILSLPTMEGVQMDGFVRKMWSDGFCSPSDAVLVDLPPLVKWKEVIEAVVGGRSLEACGKIKDLVHQAACAWVKARDQPGSAVVAPYNVLVLLEVLVALCPSSDLPLLDQVGDSRMLAERSIPKAMRAAVVHITDGAGHGRCDGVR